MLTYFEICVRITKLSQITVYIYNISQKTAQYILKRELKCKSLYLTKSRKFDSVCQLCSDIYEYILLTWRCLLKGGNWEGGDAIKYCDQMINITPTAQQISKEQKKTLMISSTKK